MIPALLVFSRLRAGGLFLWFGYLVGATTIGRALETPAQALRDKLHGREWRSRKEPMAWMLVSAAWLYATWGV